MELVIKLTFWFDGIEDATDEEIRDYVISMLDSGAEATCCDVDNILVENENGIIR